MPLLKLLLNARDQFVTLIINGILSVKEFPPLVVSGAFERFDRLLSFQFIMKRCGEGCCSSRLTDLFIEILYLPLQSLLQVIRPAIQLEYLLSNSLAQYLLWKGAVIFQTSV
jgi:hypothetical protein